MHCLELAFDLTGDRVRKVPNPGGLITIKREHSDDRIKECVGLKKEKQTGRRLLPINSPRSVVPPPKTV